MINDKISIITVCRNCQEQLATTLQSVAKQTYKNLEYIVVDGASTDSTPSILSQSDAITRWISEPDKGIYDAMNKGTALATGDWVIFMNAGDQFASADTLAKIMELGEESDDVIYGDVIKIDSNGNRITKRAEPIHNSHRMIFCHQSVICRRDLLIETPFDIRHKMSADFKFFKQILKQGAKFHRIDIPVSIFDTGGVSNRRRSEGLADNMKVIAEVDGYLKGLPHLLHLLPTYVISRLRGK